VEAEGRWRETWQRRTTGGGAGDFVVTLLLSLGLGARKITFCFVLLFANGHETENENNLSVHLVAILPRNGAALLGQPRHSRGQLHLVRSFTSAPVSLQRYF
jgi:hypothetical protein